MRRDGVVVPDVDDHLDAVVGHVGRKFVEEDHWSAISVSVDIGDSIRCGTYSGP